MSRKVSLIIIKLIHTLIWIFFNLVIGYLVYAVLINKIDKWIWICYSLIAAEGLILLLFGKACPVTLIARRYSGSTKNNFDIYLPEWLAKYNKLIYTVIVGLTVLLLFYRLGTRLN